ncbi:MAG TPA: alpha-2-macroglobulin family protein, partial [Candidatus Deferrimicrobium sp.]|nr:alpha-2-macroglobulin family protein [Candidatus Deferrimicrobium sp.]
EGAFEITFNAVPDTSIPKDTQPAFNFTVYAEVTDINGETQQTEKKIPIGYIALKIGLDIPEKLDKDPGKYSFNIISTTLSGDFVNSEGEIAIHKLKEPARVFRKKLWETPDRFTMSREEYYKLFPHDSYAGEDDYRQWEKEKQVFNGRFDTKAAKQFQLDGLNRWETGKYVVEMTSRDKYGTVVKEVIYFTLYSGKGKDLPGRPLDWFAVPKSIFEPGETAVILIGSAAPDVRVIYELEYRGKILAKKYLDLNKEQKRIEIPILEKYRGNIGVHLVFIKYNRVFMYNATIAVPWTDKELEITFETFRNKLLPGEKEEWRLKIRGKKGKGPKGEAGSKVEAEMLATLYDASLDAFRPLYWAFDIYPNYYSRLQWEINNYFGIVNTSLIGSLQKPEGFPEKIYDQLNWFDFNWWGEGRLYKRARVGSVGAIPPPAPTMALDESQGIPGKNKMEEPAAGKPPVEERPAEKGVDLSTVKARTNFQETAFFYPHLRTDKNGTIIIAFTIPEALTKWKMMGFAHTKNLEYGFVNNELVTQKELMVVPNVPRFFREGDTLELNTKITNLSENELNGKVKLMLFDAVSMRPVDDKFKIKDAEKTFKTQKGQSAQAGWTLHIPDDVDTVVCRIVASAGRFSDGEEQAVPILKNRMLVTETLPLPVRAKQTKDFQFKKLIESSGSTSLKQYKLTLEFTANPVWYAVQALPYLMEFPYECLEQIFSRYYANSIAIYIANKNPGIKQVFEIWKRQGSEQGTGALLSNLEKNQELKSLLLEETPWVLNAQDETERKHRIALLFDLSRMAVEQDAALNKLSEGQMPSGAWPWFNGMYENRYITQHIVCGFAYLDRLNVIKVRNNQKVWTMIKNAVLYLDRKLKEDYDLLLKYNAKLDEMQIDYNQVFYLYGRSYFKDIPMDDAVNKAFAYYKGQAEKYWLKFNKYLQGMIALALNRYDNHKTAVAIVESIKEHALYSEEMGMYWKETWSYYWYQMPVETQALLIEVFDEVLNDQKSVEEMKTWLLKQKQTQDWRTTKATANACYALLLKGENWLAENNPPEITLGKERKIIIEPLKMDNVKVEAGTGYFKTSWSGSEVTPDMGYITVKNNNNVVAWGSLYWQYFETLEKITPAETPLQLKKQLFIEKPSDTGPVLQPLTKGQVKVGDKIKVRIELRVDRDMEYVHMKDMRASGFEPMNVISGVRWQGGLYYYESTRDASTNFFFDRLPKGTYVFEYPLRVSHEGDFSNGITTIQSMYAPEFSSHSEGIRVQVVEK